jgi:uncharacterized protein (TIGR00369 family)
MSDRERRIEITWEDPLALGTEARSSAGLPILERIRDGELPPAPIQELLGFSLTEVEKGRVVFTATPGEQHYNPIGVVHAGLAATLLDSATGAAVHSTLAEGSGYATLETKFNLVRPVTKDTGRISAEGRVVNRGSRVATAEAHLRSDDGKLLAHATSTCLILMNR